MTLLVGHEPKQRGFRSKMETTTRGHVVCEISPPPPREYSPYVVFVRGHLWVFFSRNFGLPQIKRRVSEQVKLTHIMHVYVQVHVSCLMTCYCRERPTTTDQQQIPTQMDGYLVKGCLVFGRNSRRNAWEYYRGGWGSNAKPTPGLLLLGQGAIEAQLGRHALEDMFTESVRTR